MPKAPSRPSQKQLTLPSFASASHNLFPVDSEPWKPHNYQKKAVKFLLEHGAAGLFLDPGLGKTSIVMAALKLLFKAKVIDKVLIIAPLLVAHSTWPGELEKWTDFHGLRMVVLHGPKKDELLKVEADIYVINPEGLDWLLQTTKTKSLRTGKVKVEVDVRRFKSLGFDVLVIDELTKFKNHGADRFKAMKHVIGTFRHRWGLTGSPAANGLLQLFGQMFMLDEGRSLGRFVTQYQKQYFIQAWSGFGWQLRTGAEEQIYERISPLVLRMAAEDYLDMPKVVNNSIMLELDDKLFAKYLQLEDQLLMEMDDKKIVAKTAGIATGKCRQFAAGAIFTTPDVNALFKPGKTDREWVHLHDLKIEALKELIEEMQGQPLLIAYEFQHDQERLRKAFPDAVFACDTKPSKFKQLEDAWNSGAISNLFAQPQNLSHGLNLQKAGNHVAWFTTTWDFEVYDQFNRRVRRQGNTNSHIFVHHIVIKNTVDEVVLNTLIGKEKGQQSLFDGLKKLSRIRKS